MGMRPTWNGALAPEAGTTMRIQVIQKRKRLKLLLTGYLTERIRELPELMRPEMPLYEVRCNVVTTLV
jgi:hypothetical protein